MDTVCIDGSIGEGGGQVLRTSLSLSAITERHLRIHNIRANRPRPGLARQHLACVEAACKICNAKCDGASLGSTQLEFAPSAIRAGDYRFDIGSAGSALLVMQTILPVLFCAEEASSVTVTGGTHNPWAPPFDFIEETFLPAIAEAGFHAQCRLLKHGFFPAGGGKISFEIEPRQVEGGSIDLCRHIIEPKATAKIYTAQLPKYIAHKQRRLIPNAGLNILKIEHIDVSDSDGAGNCIMIRVCGQNYTRLFTGFGSEGKPSQRVVNEAVGEAGAYLASGAGVDHFLADQLLIYMGLQKAGRLTTNELSSHLSTNIEVIQKFLPVEFEVIKRETYYEISCRVR